MRIRVLGCGWYGCHLTAALLAAGHDVQLFDTADGLFAGASGGNPARCHLGFHYPRSAETRIACLNHQQEFQRAYGHVTHAVPVNIYAIAAEDSLVDFGTYVQVMNGVQFIALPDPSEFGLRNVEGAVLTGERHVLIHRARDHFEALLAGRVSFGAEPGYRDDPAFDLTIDCTFSALAPESIDRYEPCITGILSGPVERAVTIMDGPFPSIYVWDELRGLSSITSAKLTPLVKTCATYAAAQEMLARTSPAEAMDRVDAMLDQIAHFWPAARDLYQVVDFKKSIRAMPKSKADSRLCDVSVVSDRLLRVRAGKIDAIFHAERLVKEHLGRMGGCATLPLSERASFDYVRTHDGMNGHALHSRG